MDIPSKEKNELIHNENSDHKSDDTGIEPTDSVEKPLSFVPFEINPLPTFQQQLESHQQLFKSNSHGNIPSLSTNNPKIEQLSKLPDPAKLIHVNYSCDIEVSTSIPFILNHELWHRSTSGTIMNLMVSSTTVIR